MHALLFWAFFVQIVFCVGGTMYVSRTNEDTVYGRSVSFCPYQSLRLLPGSNIRDYDNCMECLCQTNGIDCKPIGETITGVAGDSVCEAVKIGCKNVWVMKKNKHEPCPLTLVPTVYRTAYNY